MAKVSFKGDFRDALHPAGYPDCTLFVTADVHMEVGQMSDVSAVLEKFELPGNPTAYRLRVFDKGAERTGTQDASVPERFVATVNKK